MRVRADLVADAAQQTADEITSKLGPGIGVAGSGISGCGPAVGLAADITNRESVRALLRQAVRFGVVESLNTTIKSIIRRARGIRDEALLLLKLKWATARPIRSARDLLSFLTAKEQQEQ